MAEPIRWGILGTGKIARALATALQDVPDAVLAGVASRSLEKAEAFAADFHASTAYGSYEELAAAGDIDLVYIATPHPQHAANALLALNAGKGVLCEKPFTMNRREAAHVVDLARSRKLFLMEAMWTRFMPALAEVKRLIAAGEIGSVHQVVADFGFTASFGPEHRVFNPELGGGALPDIGVYPTIATRFVTGKEPVRVQAKVERDPDFGTDIYASVKAAFETFEMSFYISTQMASRQLMVFHGREGTIEVKSPFNADRWGAEEIELTNQKHNVSQIFRFPDSRQYRRQAEAFAKAAKGEAAEIVTLENSLLNQRFIDAIYRAGETDGWETV